MLRLQVTFVMIAAAVAWTIIGISGHERLGHFSMIECSSACPVKPIPPLDFLAGSISWSPHNPYTLWSQKEQQEKC